VAPRFSSPKALITLPRLNRPILMLIPSLRRSPLALIFFCLSDPAKSTMWNLETVNNFPSDLVRDSTINMKIACDRLLLAFMAVAAVTLPSLAFSSKVIVCSTELMSISVNPGILMPLLPSSLISTIVSSRRVFVDRMSNNCFFHSIFLGLCLLSCRSSQVSHMEPEFGDSQHQHSRPKVIKPFPCLARFLLCSPLLYSGSFGKSIH